MTKFRVRARYDVVVAYDDAYVRFTSDAKRSLTPEELVEGLQETIRFIENGMKSDPPQPYDPPVAHTEQLSAMEETDG